MSESLTNWTDQLQVASLSDVGMRRVTNQDNLSVSLANSNEHYHRKGHLFVVADGMGAHAAGELASKLAIDHIPHLYNKYNNSSAPEELKKSVQDANIEIYRRGQANEEFHNMGTTCSVLTLLPQGAVVAHIGDSRVYRLTQNRLEQLTFDHSLVWEMKAAGQLTAEEEKAGKIPKNVITRSLGPYPECKVDLEGPFPIQVGDTFLLCSDGLTAVITDSEIGAILANMNPDEAVQVLVDLSNLRGGPDNITVVIVKITHPQMATQGGAAPVRVNVTRVASSLAPFLWAIFAAATLFTLLFYFWSGWQTALLPGVVAIGSLIFIAIRLILSTGSGESVSSDKRFGKGPYVRIGCPQGPQFSKQLADILSQLQKGALKQSWAVDWEQWNAKIAEAESAVKSKDYSRSIRSYSRAISFLMDQLRNQTEGSSSSIDL
jgi:protein phosphatase